MFREGKVLKSTAPNFCLLVMVVITHKARAQDGNKKNLEHV